MNPVPDASRPPDPNAGRDGLPDQTSFSPARETTSPERRRASAVPRAGLGDRDRPGPGRRLLGLKEAAAVLGVSTVSIRRLIWKGKLPVVRIVRRIQIDTRDLDRLIEQSKQRIDW
jgi:excisionase family DNA binding protein